MNTTRIISLKSQTTKISISSLIVAVMTFILLVTPAFAAAPENGTVYEGQSVPGVKLGATRSDVTASYGEALTCDNAFGDLPRNTYTCTYAVESGGSFGDAGGVVDVTFKRSFLSMSILPKPDTVIFIRWSQEVSGWKTTAGVNTELAASDPRAVIEAYPNASVEFNSDGDIIQVRDAGLGIQIDWKFEDDGDQLNQEPRVSMGIFFPEKDTIGINR